MKIHNAGHLMVIIDQMLCEDNVKSIEYNWRKGGFVLEGSPDKNVKDTLRQVNNYMLDIMKKIDYYLRDCFIWDNDKLVIHIPDEKIYKEYYGIDYDTLSKSVIAHNPRDDIFVTQIDNILIYAETRMIQHRNIKWFEISQSMQLFGFSIASYLYIQGEKYYKDNVRWLFPKIHMYSSSSDAFIGTPNDMVRTYCGEYTPRKYCVNAGHGCNECGQLASARNAIYS